MSDVEAPDDVKQATRALVDELGVEDASRRLGVSRESVMRVLAGIRIRSGTLAQVERELSKRRTA